MDLITEMRRMMTLTHAKLPFVLLAGKDKVVFSNS